MNNEPNALLFWNKWEESISHLKNLCLIQQDVCIFLPHRPINLILSFKGRRRVVLGESNQQ